MPVSEAFRVAKGGFTSLAGEIDHVARAGLAALRRQLNALTTRVATVEGVVGGDALATIPSQQGLTVAALADDEAMYIEFDAAARGVMVLSGNVGPAGNVIIAFRCGDALAHATAMTTVSFVTVGAGTLAGTTGVDGDLTIRANTANNRIYIENRTGAVRGYGMQFVAMQTASFPADPAIV